MKRKIYLFLLFLPLISKPIEAQERPLGGIATQHPLATRAAAQILKNGGNAFDAAVAAALTLAVVEPYNSGMGAGGMALVWKAGDDKVHAVDFREKAPLGAHPQMYQQPGLSEDPSRLGPLAIAVPGEIAGLQWIQQRWGKLAWASLFTEAIQTAELGWEADEELLRRAAEKKDCLSRDYNTFKTYREFFTENNPEASEPDLLPPSAPFLWRQEDLAKTLKKLRDGGAKEFYQGSIATELVANLRSKGALLSQQDLQSYQVVEREALFADFSWGRLWGMPLPSSGGVSVIHGMNLLEALSKGDPVLLRENWRPWMTAVLSILFQDRNTAMGDPDYNPPMPLAKWISKKEATREAAGIIKSMERIGPSPLPLSPKGRGTCDECNETNLNKIRDYKDSVYPSPLGGEGGRRPGEASHTTHLSIIDGMGNAVSMTLSLNLSFGSCVTAGATGILMNNQMDDFTLNPGQANAFGLVQSSMNGILPSKRPLSSMSPTLVTQGKEILLALGSPGGPRIISSVLSTLARYFLLKEDLKQAVGAPRLHYQLQPDRVYLEQGERAAEIQNFRGLGYSIVVEKPWSNVQAVSVNLGQGRFDAVSDPRGQGEATVVYRQ